MGAAVALGSSILLLLLLSFAAVEAEAKAVPTTGAVRLQVARFFVACFRPSNMAGVGTLVEVAVPVVVVVVVVQLLLLLRKLETADCSGSGPRGSAGMEYDTDVSKGEEEGAAGVAVAAADFGGEDGASSSASSSGFVVDASRCSRNPCCC